MKSHLLEWSSLTCSEYSWLRAKNVKRPKEMKDMNIKKVEI